MWALVNREQLCVAAQDCFGAIYSKRKPPKGFYQIPFGGFFTLSPMRKARVFVKWQYDSRHPLKKVLVNTVAAVGRYANNGPDCDH